VIRVSLKAPRDAEFRFSANAYFPTQFSLQIMKAAKEQKRVFQARVYDILDKGDKLFETTTFIGKHILPTEDSMPDDSPGKKLSGHRSWPVSVSYFEVGKAEDSVPSYQLSFRLYENGVLRKLRVDYGMFSLGGKLTSLKYHEPTPCPSTLQ